MNICILQHVSFEGAGTILPFFEGAQHRVKMIHLYAGEPLPSSGWPDLLIVMGGPMGAEDDAKYPWLVEEKIFIGEVIQSGAWVLGVCLGSQLIATVLGAPVTKNETPEIGWFPVRLNQQLNADWLNEVFESEFDVLHWHGDTFAIPEGAQLLGSSDACTNQGFLWKDRVLGLQFHLEFTPESTRRLADKCPEDFIDSPWVQSAEKILAQVQTFNEANERMAKILAYIEEQIRSESKLHPQLAKDCYELCQTEQLWVLLNRNAAVPWFILVPKGNHRDLDDLSKEQHQFLFSCAEKISCLLRSDFASEKINVAALGNMVPQLHLHVIGRTSRDPCWPNPVWGHLDEQKDWGADAIRVLSERVKTILVKA